jgi:putative hydrolase of the HAD superfamily
VLAKQGWEHRILSNRVPELPQIVRGLGLSDLMTAIHNSADSGFEKPHPKAFGSILRSLPAKSVVWMVGDNLTADIRGAEAVGISAILVHKPSSEARYCCDNFVGVPAVLAEGQAHSPTKAAGHDR